MSGWTVAWIVWIGIFVVIEGLALHNKNKNDTLSEHIWHWFSVTSKERRFWRLSRFVLLAGMAWLTVHFITGGEF